MVTPPPEGATWTVLGAGSIQPRAGYGCSGYALRRSPGAPVTLFDCGPGTVRALGSAGISLLEVERVVISHFHADHCLDLFALFFARRNPDLGAVPRLEVIGPSGLEEMIEGVVAAFPRSVRDPNLATRVCEVDGAGRGGIERHGMKLSCVRTGHTPEALSWRVEISGVGSLAYTGDTGENPAVALHARDVDLLVAECSHPEGRGVPHHLTPGSAARLARQSGCRRLLLSHFYPALDPADALREARTVFKGEVEVARDGSVHRLP